ncbi:hypothetical protein HDU76_005128 [Blyttiomyces sp. JEL0837]|nr:hypothetical protein HDU76_005128 [Blyttiomyces sp. JEL0837]
MDAITALLTSLGINDDNTALSTEDQTNVGNNDHANGQQKQQKQHVLQKIINDHYKLLTQQQEQTTLQDSTPGGITKDPQWTVSIDKTGMNSDVYVIKKSNADDGGLIVKHATNVYSICAVTREQDALTKIGVYLKGLKSGSQLKVPIPLGTLKGGDDGEEGTHVAMGFLKGMNGARAMEACQNHDERVALAKAFGNAANIVHGWKPEGLRLVRVPHGQNCDSDNTLVSCREWFKLTVDRYYGPFVSAKIGKWEVQLEEMKASQDKSQQDSQDGSDKNANDDGDLEKRIERLQSAVDDTKRMLSRVQHASELPDSHPLWSPKSISTSQVSLMHGDFMLPNVLFERTPPEDPRIWKAVAVLDWGDCGYGDRRYDIKAALWSLNYNVECCLEKKDEGADNGDAVELEKVQGDVVKEFLREVGITMEEIEKVDGHEDEFQDVWADLYELYDVVAYDEEYAKLI